MTMDRSTPRCRGFASAVIFAALLLSPALAGHSPAAAQDPGSLREDTPLESTPPREIVISPRSGPPGTQVTIRPSSLPGMTPVVISIGGTRSGFEELAQTATDTAGALVGGTTFEIPDWAESDRNYVFMVMDIYFRPLAASEIFFVTGPEGTVVRTGRISEEETGCTALRGDGGELYSLTGATDDVRVGDRVLVEGTLSESSDCPRGTSLRVVRIQRMTGSSGSARGSTTQVRPTPAGESPPASP